MSRPTWYDMAEAERRAKYEAEGVEARVVFALGLPLIAITAAAMLAAIVA